MNEFSVLYDDVCQRVSRSLTEALKPFDGIDTVATHGGYNPVYLEEVGRPVVPPITLSSTFQQLSPGVAKVIRSCSVLTFLSMTILGLGISLGSVWKSA